jgi:lipoprotein-anchoring transpeptidase ErfK/SrfK
VDKSQNVLLLKAKEEIFKTYTVSTGKNNCTPVGNFKITNKLINPTWFKSGAVIPSGSPENVLGTRWLGFDLPGYGIHGTNEPQNLGKQVTEGCVRLQNCEIEELYTIVPTGTEVSIVN